MSYRSPDEAIVYARDREADAAGFYELLSRRVEQPATRAMFEALAAEERRHQVQLEALRPADLAGWADESVTVPVGIASPTVKYQPDMSFVDALRLALQREDESVRLYQLLHDRAPDSAVGGLFSVLIDQERQHQRRLQDELDRVVLKED